MNDILNKHFESIETHRRLVWQIGNVLKINPELLVIHDLSKYRGTEFRAYAEWFGGNKNEKSEAKFKIAWKHHYTVNRHHWKYWILDGTKSVVKIIIDIDSNNVIPMEYEYITEMVCDWQAMEIQHYDRQDMSGWLNKNFDEMVLHKETRRNVIDVLDKIGYSYFSENGFILDKDNKAAKEINRILQKNLNDTRYENTFGS